jgi:hypothetical protein
MDKFSRAFLFDGVYVSYFYNKYVRFFVAKHIRYKCFYLDLVCHRQPFSKCNKLIVLFLIKYHSQDVADVC